MSSFFHSSLRLLTLLVMAISIFLTSCKSKEKIVAPQPKADYMNAKALMENLKKNEFKFNWLSAKLDCEARIDSNSNSFEVQFRAKKDSIIWMNITAALGVVKVARVIISKDSVKFVDFINEKYFVGDFNYLSKMLHADLDFELIQSLLIGNSVEFYDDDEKLRAFTEDGKNVLSTIRKKKLKRVIERNKELKDPAQIIWLMPETFKISRLLFKDFNTNRTFEAKYDKFEKVDSLLLPNKAEFDIKAEKNITMKMEYNKVTVNKPQTFQFSIPEKYEQIVYKEN